MKAFIQFGYLVLLGFLTNDADGVIDRNNANDISSSTVDVSIESLRTIEHVCSVVDSIGIASSSLGIEDLPLVSQIFFLRSGKTPFMLGVSEEKFYKNHYYSFEYYKTDEGTYQLLYIDPVGSCWDKTQPADSIPIEPLTVRTFRVLPRPHWRPSPPQFAGGFYLSIFWAIFS